MPVDIWIIHTSRQLQVTETISGIMTAVSSAQQSEVKAWEEEILACEHTLTLEQMPLINPDDPCKLQPPCHCRLRVPNGDMARS